MTRGRLIAFEGLDQSGKQTQAEWLVAALTAAGHTARTVSFPDYATAIGAEIGQALQGRRSYGPDVLQLLYIANRYEHAPAIRAWLSEGAIVVADRYAASSLAYGDAQGLDLAWLTDAQRLLPPADLTFLLDIAPETSLERKRAARDKFERDLPLLSRVRASYVRQAEAPGWHVMDGTRDAEAVRADVTGAVRARLGLL
ncbi:MAG: dTMP kinase [Acidobacteria bacterium]|nr:dTMP kinase [Acidobacteriota bacterium]